LIKIRDIERETFDFKGIEFRGLYQHLCAFANFPISGMMVLGIEEEKSSSGFLKQFSKVGFDVEKEDWVRNEINNQLAHVEPIPKLNIKYLYDDNRIYPVLKIEGEDIHRPYFLKDKGQCYVRIDSSTSPASRTAVLNLFSNLITKRIEVQRLCSAASFLKEALMYTAQNIHDIQPRDMNAKILEVDLTYIRNAALSAEWFLIENNLLGGHINIDSFAGGLYSFLHDIERVNLSIKTHNNYSFVYGKQARKDSVIQLWEPGRQKYNEAIGFLDKVLAKCNEYLSKN
jgi:hypothetical protein